MFMETPQTLMIATLGAFVLGWVIAKIGSHFSDKVKARRRDPRDDRIRSLEAELRIAKSEGEKVRAELSEREKDLTVVRKTVEEREATLEGQRRELDKLRADLKESVLKTRELRSELSDRATENLRSEVKLREVETELSVVQASTDLIATGALDFSFPSDQEEDDDPSAQTAETGR